jgi:hypothetical protein
MFRQFFQNIGMKTEFMADVGEKSLSWRDPFYGFQRLP